MKILRIILALFLFTNYAIAQKSNNSNKINKKIELDLINLWDEYSGNLDAYSLGYFFGKEAIAPETYNNFKIFKNGNKIIWTQSSQKYGTDIYDGIYSLIVESTGTIVKLKCKFNLRNAGRTPSTPERTLIIDLSKSSGICVKEKKEGFWNGQIGKGQTFNIFTQKALSKIREDEIINRIKESEEAQRKYENEKKEQQFLIRLKKQAEEDLILKQKKEEEALIKKYEAETLEKLKKINDFAKKTVENPITIGKIFIANNDFAEPMDWYDAKKACEALGYGWRLPTLVELKILYRNKDKIGGFISSDTFAYWSSTDWSSTEVSNGNGAWFMYFNKNTLRFGDSKTTKHFVRAVKDL